MYAVPGLCLALLLGVSDYRIPIIWCALASTVAGIGLAVQLWQQRLAQRVTRLVSVTPKRWHLYYQKNHYEFVELHNLYLFGNLAVLHLRHRNRNFRVWLSARTQQSGQIHRPRVLKTAWGK